MEADTEVEERGKRKEERVFNFQEIHQAIFKIQTILIGISGVTINVSF